MHGRVWLQTPHPVNAENAEADVANRSMSVTLTYCGQTVGWIKTKLGMEVGLGPDTLWGPSSPEKGHNSPHFSVHVYSCQTAGCIKMPLGVKVGLGPGDIVLDGNVAPSSQRGTVPQFACIYCGQTVSAAAQHLMSCYCTHRFCLAL